MLLKQATQSTDANTRPEPHYSVTFIKSEIRDDVNQKVKKDSRGMSSQFLEKDEYTDSCEVDDIRNRPITPFMPNKERKEYNKFKLKQIKSTTAMEIKVGNFFNNSLKRFICASIYLFHYLLILLSLDDICDFH